MRKPFSEPSFKQFLRIGRRGTCVLLAAVLYASVRPAAADVAVGSSSAGFLNFEVGARSAGMGGAQVAGATGVTAQFWNPAGLATLSKPEIGAMHASWLGDLKYEWLGYARPLGPKTGVGSVSMAYFHLPSISGVDAFDNPTGEFRVYDAALTAGLARPLGRGVSAGANAKFIRQSLAGVSGTGAAIDLGASAALYGTTLGVSVQNLGPGVSLGGASNPLPRQVRIGASRSFYQNRLLVATDYNMPSDYFRDLRIGTEFRAHDVLSLRAGYRREFGTVNDPSTGFSFGAGIHFQQWSVDYAMTPSDVFDNVQRVSFGYSFGGGTEQAKPEPKKPDQKKPEAPPPPAPKKPPVIASVKPVPQRPASETVQPTAQPAAQSAVSAPRAVAEAPSETPKPVTKAPEAPKSDEIAQAKPAEPAPHKVGYDVVLGSYQSEESAKSEIKALQILGFPVKNAKITYDPTNGYQLSLARFGSKKSADDLAESLAKMSFRSRVVEMVQR